MTAPPPIPNRPANRPVTTPATTPAGARAMSSAANSVTVLPALSVGRFDRRAGDASFRRPAEPRLGRAQMAVVETEEHGQILVVRMNRPERLNALNHEMRTRLAETWSDFRKSDRFEVAIFTGTGR